MLFQSARFRIAEMKGSKMTVTEQSGLPLDGLRQRLDAVDPVALLLASTHLTGDRGLLREEWRPDLSVGVVAGGYPAETRDDIGRACVAALERVGAAWERARPSYDLLERSVEWAMGAAFAPYTSLLAESLSFGPGDDPGMPLWHRSTMAPAPQLRVAIVGAGETGMLIAHRLRQAGVQVMVFEKNPDVGGTWHDNTYPGSRVDLSSAVYRYSCHPSSWDSHFSTQPAMQAYLREFAEENGLYEDIEFNSEVLSSSWDDANRDWVLTVRSDDDIREVRATVQVNAVGQLNRPHIPAIPGSEQFDGPAFHTARWNHSIDLTGKRVGVIGTGASGMQMIPAIAEQAAEVRVFARTSTFLLPTPHLRHDLGEAEKWLLAELPHYRAWYRAVAFLPGIEGMLSAVTVDPNYPPTERAVSATSEQMRAALQVWIDAQTEDDLQLRDALTPRAPFGAKRWVADDGTWITTLKRPDVHLVRDPIREITESGVRCADDQLHELDVLIYATGFRASEFLAPMQVTGRGAVDLQQHWAADDARAYLGSCVPGFPNFFCLYGPNTNVVVHGASLFFISECLVRYVVDAVRTMLETGSSVIEVRESVARAYDERLDEVSTQRAWAFSSVRSFYKNSTGRSTLLWPFTAMELWQRTHRIDPADFLLHT
jgi:4-hydroxyacetophenone monooxygenase